MLGRTGSAQGSGLAIILAAVTSPRLGAKAIEGLMIVLGIETTCDETAAAWVERFEDGHGRILSNVVLSQVTEHAAFGGVVPAIAASAQRHARHVVIDYSMILGSDN